MQSHNHFWYAYGFIQESGLLHLLFVSQERGME